MKSLKTIQVFAKIGRILSKIIFILSVVGFCLCIVGVVSLAVGFDGIKIGGTTVRSIFANEAGLSMATLYTSAALGALLCAAEAVISKFAEVYFRNELKDGTPFTHRGARELTRLGILSIAIPLATAIVRAIIILIVGNIHPEVEKLDSEIGFSFISGIMMIVLSVFCRYGADLREGKMEAPDETE